MADYPPLKGVAYEIQWPMFSATTGALMTGLSPATTISKDGGTHTTTTNSASEVATASGDYKLTVTLTEHGADRLAVHATAAGARDVFICWETVTRQIKDVLYSGQANSITAAMLAADVDTYQATVKLTDDNGGTTDRYTVAWYKNSAPVTSGITSPTINVYKESDGSDLIASTAMTQIASTATYKYDAVTTERITDGAAYIAKVEASIGGGTRSWKVGISRDSS